MGEYILGLISKRFTDRLNQQSTHLCSDVFDLYRSIVREVILEELGTTQVDSK